MNYRNLAICIDICKKKVENKSIKYIFALFLKKKYSLNSISYKAEFYEILISKDIFKTPLLFCFYLLL